MPRSSTPSMSIPSMFTPCAARQVVRRAAMPTSLGTRTVSCFMGCSVRGSRFAVLSLSESSLRLDERNGDGFSLQCSRKVGGEFVNVGFADMRHDQQVTDVLLRSD